MNRPQRDRRRAAFTLAEVLVALLFVSIALLGYASLHMRLIHSGFRLEGRQTHREQVQTELSQVVAQQVQAANFGRLSTDAGVTPSAPTPAIPQLQRLTARSQWTDECGPQSIVVETLVGPEDAGW